MGGWGFGGWVAGLSKNKTKPNPKLKLELKFGAELCNNAYMHSTDLDTELICYN